MKKNLLVAHGGGPTAVINASLAGLIEQAIQSRTYDNIYAAIGGVEGFLKEKIVHIGSLSKNELNQLKHTPSSAIGSCRYKLTEVNYQQFVSILERYNISTFIYNGGNDSMESCLKISQLADELNVIGIPKTIDNDLAETDHSPGFGSAARYTALTTRELNLDIQALPLHVSVIEFMGRNTGWLTAASALARSKKSRAPHLIYLPERPFSQDRFLKDVIEAKKEFGSGFVIAVSEGLKDTKGKPVVSTSYKTDIDSFGHAIPGNLSPFLANIISRELGMRARSEKPGLIGRASLLTTSSVDREEAFNLGKAAVTAANQGLSGIMVGLKRVSDSPYQVEVTHIPLKKVANVERFMPDCYISEKGCDVTTEFMDYTYPLIGGDLPDYFQLEERKNI